MSEHSSDKRIAAPSAAVRQVKSLWWRLRLRRLWGPRSTWTGNNAQDVTVVERPDAEPSRRWLAKGWTICRCGREFPVFATGHNEEMARSMCRLAGGLCRACVAMTERHHRHCPHGNCQLGYWHTGRCRPYDIPAHVRALLGDRP